MANPDIAEMEEELQTMVRSVSAFKDSGFSVFDANDLEGLSNAQNFPIVGVSYDGAIPQSQKGNEGSPVAAGAGAARLVTIQFTIIIGVQYHYAGETDTKKQAFALLAQVRKLLLGYSGVNRRPWSFVGERPEFLASGNGIVFYSQVWQTAIANVGS